ncbi:MULTISPECIES: L-2-hydroxyglutarate oxidase [unclassified Rhodococcus (in: high G+C Gram-positive bacteria)]|uniref:L-2-hydroxyglutarate oxidase n=1 Tax=unclassified Rhodococcus (in: high G+C Gram-positive bacteria) TaxID=192944 RepID=UPI0006F20EE2|nr:MULTISPECIES: L-2-hydroxyglutarate oxidase [unclassified Rhodococcus (in: high G+C Gram-positive bacteria)]KQU28366.1 hydroxyglutarate oxidase [Rhodococcus sp. Leaf225]KQU46473.1 hydroxyglutarate oxidase [Rhodococcus sp. Leaf258]
MHGGHVVVVGAGIVGLATGRALVRRGYRVTVLDKESDTATHQTGNNSGVIHSGLYYAPGSLKATLAVSGSVSMRDFAREHDLPVDVCGKLVVATTEAQVPALRALAERGAVNGVPCRMITADEAREYEPAVRAVAALRVESTGIVDYRAVCATLRREIEDAGSDVVLGAEVVAISGSIEVRCRTGQSETLIAADLLVNCAGLHSDRIARMAGVTPAVRILPFRGEYFELAPQYSHLVRGLIYPVPDPTLPFLGVHLTRMIDGTVHAGPNAVLALAREGYRWRDIAPRDVADALTWPGLWRLGRRYWRTGAQEVARSVSSARFLASLRELVPDLPSDSLVPTHAGVRAQAIHRSGALVDDFYYEQRPGQVHVLNAPSPAATAALGIAEHIVGQLKGVR